MADNAQETQKNQNFQPIEMINKWAGRNLIAAVGSGLLFIFIIVLSLVFDPRPFVVLVIVVSILAAFELNQAFKKLEVNPPIILTSVGIILIEGTAFLTNIDLFLIATFVTIFVVFLYCCVASDLKNRYKDSMSGLFIIIYIAFLTSFLLFILNDDFGQVKVALCFVSVVAVDTGAWAIGKFFGKHKFSKVLSPNKTIEGILGSIALTGVIVFLFIFLIPNPYKDNLMVAIVLTLVTPFVALFGDLSESVIKRSVGLKDMGNAIKGHGGFLDRIDSMLFMLPVFYLLTQFLFR